MENQTVTFTKAHEVEFLTSSFDSNEIGEHQILLRSLRSMISPGTELTCLNGLNSWWFSFPGIPGYANVAEVINCGNQVEGLEPGDRVLNYGPHQLYNILTDNELILKIPDHYPLELVPLTRLATVAFTAIRVSNIELGDNVIVMGMGTIGNIAAQLAKNQGGQVIAIDINDKRLELAKKCGIEKTINPLNTNPEDTVLQMTDGKKANTLIDATGNSKAIESSFNLISRMGELILLGSPREEYHTDLTKVLNYTHLFPKGSITVKGAHEHQFPKKHDNFAKHSFERNSKIIWKLQEQKLINLKHLVSHTIPANEAPDAYIKLRDQPDEYTGVILNWEYQ